jgi:glycosyltransferase involved in cell wall biosynthesis
MKICMLTSGHSYIDNRVFYKEAHTLRDQGHEVFIVVPFDPGGYFLDPLSKPIEALYPKKEFIEDNIQIFGYEKTRREITGEHPDETRYNVYSDFARYIRIDDMGDLELKLIKKGLEIDADIYHAHEISSAYAAVKIKQLKQKQGKTVKVVYDVHEYYPDVYSSLVASQDDYREKHKQMIINFDATILPYCDLVITVSEAIRGYLLQLYPKANIEVIKNVPKLRKETSKMVKNHFPIVCYEGHVRFDRGLKELIEITKELKAVYPHFKMLLVGDTVHDKDKEYLIGNIEKYSLQDSLILTGWRTPDEAAEYLITCDIGIQCLRDLAKHHLTLPNKIFNYMRAGLATISMDFTETRRVLWKENAGVTVKDLNPNSWVKAIRELIENKEQLETYKKNAIKAYETKYNWNIEGEKLARLYNDLM